MNDYWGNNHKAGNPGQYSQEMLVPKACKEVPES